MKISNLIAPVIVASLVSFPAFAQSANPWAPAYQGSNMGGEPVQGQAGPTPEQIEQMRRQRHAAMMQHRAMMMQEKQRQQKSKGAGMDCQRGGKGSPGGKKHAGKHGGAKHQAHRQQMEQRLARIESLLQQLLDQQGGAVKAAE